VPHVEQLEQPPDKGSYFTLRDPLFFFFQRIFSSALAHIKPFLRNSLLLPISLSGNLPSFLKIILKESRKTHKPTSKMDKSIIDIILTGLIITDSRGTSPWEAEDDHPSGSSAEADEL